MKLFNLTMILCCLFVFAAATTTSKSIADEKPETPTVLEGGKVITLEEAKESLARKDTTFFDTRKTINYGQGHLPGAVSVSYKEQSEFTATFDASKDSFDLSKLPADKNAKICFYSDGPKGWKSYKAAVTAIKAGYKNVSWMRQGSELWEEKKYPLEK